MTEPQQHDVQSIYTAKSEIPPPIPAFSWLGGLSPLILAPWAVLVLSIWFAPPDALTQYPLLEHFANGVRNFLLRVQPWMDIAKHANSTQYPQVALLANAMLWVFVAWAALVFMASTFYHYDHMLRRNLALKKTDIKHLFFLLTVVPVSLAMLWGLTMLPGDPSIMGGITTSSRLGYSFITSCVYYCSAGGFGIPLLIIRMFIDVHFLGKGKN